MANILSTYLPGASAKRFMTEQDLEKEVLGLKDAFADVSVAKPAGGATLVRIADALLPKGCSPKSTAALLVIQSGGGRPTLYVKSGIKLPNGAVPRSTSVVNIEGEEWLQFSYNFPWDETAHSLVQFVGAALLRFGKKE